MKKKLMRKKEEDKQTERNNNKTTLRNSTIQRKQKQNKNTNQKTIIRKAALTSTDKQQQFVPKWPFFPGKNGKSCLSADKRGQDQKTRDQKGRIQWSPQNKEGTEEDKTTQNNQNKKSNKTSKVGCGLLVPFSCCLLKNDPSFIRMFSLGSLFWSTVGLDLGFLIWPEYAPPLIPSNDVCLIPGLVLASLQRCVVDLLQEGSMIF